MKKQIVSLFLVAVLFCLTVPVSADVLWEPWDDAYYLTVSDKTTYIGRTYEVPQGMTANLYSNPSTGSVITTLDAGTFLYIGPSLMIDGVCFANGYVWGELDAEGWVNLDRLQRTYDSTDFTEDFQDSFEETDDVITADDITADIQTWTYPGSGVSGGTIAKECLDTSYNDGVVSFRYVYTDPQGGRWGYVGYYMGRYDWVWLDDPEAEETPLFLQEPENTVFDRSEETVPTNHLPAVLVAAAIVLVLSTAAAIALFRLKKKRS